MAHSGGGSSTESDAYDAAQGSAGPARRASRFHAAPRDSRRPAAVSAGSGGARERNFRAATVSDSDSEIARLPERMRLSRSPRRPMEDAALQAKAPEGARPSSARSGGGKAPSSYEERGRGGFERERAPFGAKGDKQEPFERHSKSPRHLDADKRPSSRKYDRSASPSPRRYDDAPGRKFDQPPASYRGREREQERDAHGPRARREEDYEPRQGDKYSRAYDRKPQEREYERSPQLSGYREHGGHRERGFDDGGHGRYAKQSRKPSYDKEYEPPRGSGGYRNPRDRNDDRYPAEDVHSGKPGFPRGRSPEPRYSTSERPYDKRGREDRYDRDPKPSRRREGSWSPAPAPRSSRQMIDSPVSGWKDSRSGPRPSSRDSRTRDPVDVDSPGSYHQHRDKPYGSKKFDSVDRERVHPHRSNGPRNFDRSREDSREPRHYEKPSRQDHPERRSERWDSGTSRSQRSSPPRDNSFPERISQQDAEQAARWGVDKKFIEDVRGLKVRSRFVELELMQPKSDNARNYLMSRQRNLKQVLGRLLDQQPDKFHDIFDSINVQREDIEHYRETKDFCNRVKRLVDSQEILDQDRADAKRGKSFPEGNLERRQEDLDEDRKRLLRDNASLFYKVMSRPMSRMNLLVANKRSNENFSGQDFKKRREF